MAHIFDHFWSPDRILRFRENLPAAVDHLSLSPEEVPNFISNWIKPEFRRDLVPSESTCRRAIKSQKSVRKVTLSGLLVGLSRGLMIREDKVQQNDKLQDFVGLYYQFTKECGNESYGEPTSSHDLSEFTSVERMQDDFEVGFSLLGAIFGCDTDRLEEVESLIFSETDGPEKYFDCYRFSSAPKIVKKSFMVFHRPSSHYPFVRFANFIEHRGRTRIARGLVIPFRTQLALVGHSDNGKGLKTVILPQVEGP
ncbi:MAG: hypothetical protein AAGF54_04145, partial [Pseudomonadota bacterium]